MKLIFKKSEYIKYETASESETRCDNSAENTKALVREAGLSAGICYLPETYDELQKEDTEKSEARYNKAIENGHDSITGHITVSLIAQDTPKIIAMMPNNEKEYNTSEKSGRYTVMMSANGDEMQRYEKRVDKLTKLLNSRYGDKWTVREIKAAAQENARLHLSVFTSTTLQYTTSVRQLNSVME